MPKDAEVAAVWVDVGALTPWAGNPRHNSAAIKEVKASIKRFGFASPIIARKADGMVIAGHTRLAAAKELGIDRVPVRYLDLDPAEARLLALADNKLGEIAEWDTDKLADALRDLDTEGALEGLEGIGFTSDEIDALLGGAAPSDGDASDGLDGTYTHKIKSPIYEVSGPCPAIADLVDDGKTKALITEIDSADLPSDVAAFLRVAATRHTVFNFGRIANFYAHADAEVQDLMERSALVIVDFDKAVESGFVRLTERLALLAEIEDEE